MMDTNNQDEPSKYTDTTRYIDKNLAFLKENYKVPDTILEDAFRSNVLGEEIRSQDAIQMEYFVNTVEYASEIWEQHKNDYKPLSISETPPNDYLSRNMLENLQERNLTEPGVEYWSPIVGSNWIDKVLSEKPKNHPKTRLDHLMKDEYESGELDRRNIDRLWRQLMSF